MSNADEARGAQITFDREWLANGRPRPCTSFLFDPDEFAIFSTANDLDYALVAVGQKNSGTGTLDEFGYSPLSNSPDRHRVGMNVSIIQHPNGLPKMIARPPLDRIAPANRNHESDGNVKTLEERIHARREAFAPPSRSFNPMASPIPTLGSPQLSRKPTAVTTTSFSARSQPDPPPDT